MKQKIQKINLQDYNFYDLKYQKSILATKVNIIEASLNNSQDRSSKEN